jgi:quinol monooxygenase YgiN
LKHDQQRELRPEGARAMLIAWVECQVKREKRAEFVRTAENFVARLRQVSGCVECNLMMDCEVRGLYTLLSKWESPGPLRLFLESNEFRALLGTRILLRDPPRVNVDEVLRRVRVSSRGELRLR